MLLKLVYRIVAFFAVVGAGMIIAVELGKLLQTQHSPVPIVDRHTPVVPETIPAVDDQVMLHNTSEPYQYTCAANDITAVTVKPDHTVQRWVDAAGKVHYGDTAPDNLKTETVTLDAGTKEYFTVVMAAESGRKVPAAVGTAIERGGKSIYKTLARFVDQKFIAKTHIDVLVYLDHKKYLQHLQHNMPIADDRTPGFYSPMENRVVIFHDDVIENTLETTLHEITHVINAGIFGRIPRWFNEGLAEYLENLQGSWQSTTIKPAREWLVLLAQDPQPLLLQDFLVAPDTEWMGKGRGRYYAYSWALVYFLMEPVNRDLTKKLLDELARDKCDDTDFTLFFDKHYVGGLNQLQRDWQAWLKQGVKAPHTY